jgi:2,3-bisphosphoglycerate-independent phosphoglycerate mutase
LLVELMTQSEEVFADHPVNKARRRAGKPPVTNVWLWGQGSAPKLEPFDKLYGVRGAMITAVDLLRGLAELIGWTRIDVPGATGYLDTDYVAKGRAAMTALKDFDLVCVHIEATDEASHEGRADAKIEALEQIDQHIVAPVFEALHGYSEWRVLVSPDHPTPVRTKTHSHGDVPIAMAGSGIEQDEFSSYDDPTAARSTLYFPDGWKVMGRFIRG